MSRSNLQFRVSHLIAATALVAGILASAVYLPTTYQTDGAVGPLFIGLQLAPVWIVGVVCIFVRRLRIPAVVVTLLVCGLFSWRQARLIERLRQLEVEVPRIVAYVENYRNEHEGECPEDLSGYEFERPKLAAHIRYAPPCLYDPRTGSDARPFRVRFHPDARRDPSRWFTSAGEYWYDND